MLLLGKEPSWMKERVTFENVLPLQQPLNPLWPVAEPKFISLV